MRMNFILIFSDPGVGKLYRIYVLHDIINRTQPTYKYCIFNKRENTTDIPTVSDETTGNPQITNEKNAGRNMIS